MSKIGIYALLAVAAVAPLSAQQGGQAPAGPPRTGKSVAPIDITGYWVSQIVDEWRFRVTPIKGDIPYMPVNAAARKAAEAWDPVKDEADGNACRAYGAVGIMQRPGRMHIVWQDDNTLKLDIDTGTQTRIFHFNAQTGAKAAASWQGDSQAIWLAPGNVQLFTGDTFVPALGGRRGPAGPPPTGTLKVTTNNMKPGYLRKNGVPYSDKAVLTEYFNLLKDGDIPYLVMTAFVEDPTYLNQPFIRTYTWKPVPDNRGWDPTPCLAK
ncbi:MAG: hypothetical protein ABL995_17725 [Bryobacteraceae bacterium]